MILLRWLMAAGRNIFLKASELFRVRRQGDAATALSLLVSVVSRLVGIATAFHMLFTAA